MTADERHTLDGLMEFLRLQEANRKELRSQDDHWRERMEQKTDKMFSKLDDLHERYEGVPGLVDQRVLAAISDHVNATAGATGRGRTLFIVAGIVVALAVAATLELVDRERIASAILTILMPVVAIGGWSLAAWRNKS